MLIEPTNESPDIIQAYLSYLQEMSRKITLRSGMENVLYRTTKKKYHYYLPDSSLDLRYLNEVKDHIDKEPDRKLFLGNGLVLGLITKKKNKKYIASPLVYFLVDIDKDDNGRIVYEIEWDSVSLNYDLVTWILQRDSEEENDLEENSDSNKLLINSFNNNEVFENIEKELEQYLNQEDFIEKLSNPSLATDCFLPIKNQVEEFKQTVISDTDFTWEQIDKLMKKEGLTFFNHLFFYVGSLPGQLSTYTALRKLIQEVK